MTEKKCTRTLERHLSFKITVSIFIVMAVIGAIVFSIARLLWIKKLEGDTAEYASILTHQDTFLERIYKNDKKEPLKIDNEFLAKKFSELERGYFIYKDNKVSGHGYFDTEKFNNQIKASIEKSIKDDKISYIRQYDGNYYVFMEIKYKDSYIYFYHDITYAFTFQDNLFKVIGIAGFFILITLYYISLWITRKVFEPVKENTKLLAEFNHNVSHELRTPISIVKSNLELMEYVEDKKEFMQSSMDELKEMENIINSMLIISKNKKPTNFETVDIEEITTKYVEKLKENYEKNLDFEFINNGGKKVRANLELAFILKRNLVENLYKYATPNSKVQIIMNLDKIIIKNKYDSGIKLNNNLITPFFQGDKSRNTKGYGLGLSIIKRVCELHNFKYQIHSKLDICIQEITIK